MTDRSRGKGRLWITLLLVGAAVTAGATYVLAIRSGLERREARLAITPDKGLEALAMTPFVMRDQDGREVRRDDLLGHIVVFDFLFTNCPFICPPLSANMRTLQEQLAGVEGVLLVSVSVDPRHDTPETLRAYADRLGADTARWWFLTGEFEEARRLSEEGFSLALTIDEETRVPLGGGETMDNVIHSGKFVMVGPDGRVVTMVSGLEESEVVALGERIRKAARKLTQNDTKQDEHAH
ncbi:MAG: SCO family protein [Phycisphaerales bacterium]